MRHDSARAAARLLSHLWTSGTTVAALPEPCRPATARDGWDIQRALDELAGRAVGWKISATSGAGQRHIGADGPVAGRLYERCIVASGAHLDARALTMRSLEPEFAFRIGHDLEPSDEPFDRERVLAAVASAHPAIEVPDSRFSDFTVVGLPSLIADAMCAAFLVVGDAVASWDPRDLPATGVVVRRDGDVVAVGSGRDVLGNPCDALVLLVNHLRERGQSLIAGDIVTTGASAPPSGIGPGSTFEADFGEFGQATVSFRADDRSD